MSTESAARHDLPPEKFPLVIEALHWKTRDVVWKTRVEKPARGEKALIRIPGLRHLLGHPVAIRITFGDGEVRVHEPLP